MTSIVITPTEVREKNEEFHLIIEVLVYENYYKKRTQSFNIRLPIREHELMDWMKRLFKAQDVALQHTTFLAIVDQNGGRLIVGPKYH